MAKIKTSLINFGKALTGKPITGNNVNKILQNIGQAITEQSCDGKNICCILDNIVAQAPAAPTFSPVAGTYGEAQTVTISCETESAAIEYKIGTDGTWTTYSAALTVSETATIFARAKKNGLISDVSEIDYTITTEG